MTTAPGAATAQATRRAFREARQSLAAAILAGDRRAAVDAAWRVLRAADRLRTVVLCPSARDRRTRVRWRRWALQAIRQDPPDYALLRRAMALQGYHHHDNGADGAQEKRR